MKNQLYLLVGEKTMDYSKQKLLLSLLIEFNLSFSKQINESTINQEMEQYIKKTVKELSDKQYRGSIFDNKLKEIIEKIESARTDEHLVFNDYTGKIWNEITQISRRTTSFSTAYSIMNMFGDKKDASFN